MIREVETDNYITAEELSEIGRLCDFLKTGSGAIFPDDIEIGDVNCEKIGRVRYEADIETFVFVPAIFEQEDCR